MWDASDGLSDETLLAGLAVGEVDAGTAFVRRFQRRVYGLALTILNDPAMAEDVAQEAFARAWRHAPAYDARRGSVAAWLLAITRNLSIDTLRMRRAEPADPETIIALQLPATGAGPDDRAALADDAAKLRVALRDLPEEQRRALVLAAYYGRTAKEISESEQIPLGTAKTRIRSGMLKLRAALVTEGSS